MTPEDARAVLLQWLLHLAVNEPPDEVLNEVTPENRDLIIGELLQMSAPPMQSRVLDAIGVLS